MNYLVAVSGGIDSVVLLDMLVAEGGHTIATAHFDHGIRPDSTADARFVEALASKYNVPFVSRREELGARASEELARERRYAFLRSEAKKWQATLVTAHHADDIVETVALNLSRGTGWRGLAVLDAPGMYRPLLALRKEDIREYALKNRLEWVEDSTNESDIYFRNRLRSRIYGVVSEDARRVVVSLRNRQVEIKRLIESEVVKHIGQSECSRYFFIYIDPKVAIEILRALVLELAGRSLTRPQLYGMLMAIKTARANTFFTIGEIEVKFAIKTFTITVKTP